MRISARAIFEALLPQLEHVGCHPRALLTEAAFAAYSLEETQGLYLDASRLFEVAHRELGDPLALTRLAWQEGTPETPWTLLLSSEENVGTFLRRLAEYSSSFVGGAAVETAAVGSTTRLLLRTTKADPATVEWTLAVWAGLLRAATGRAVAIRAFSFEHSPRAAPSAYREILGDRVSFRNGWNGFQIATEDLSRALVRRSPLVASTMRRLLDQQERDRVSLRDHRLIARSRVAILGRMVLEQETKVASIAADLSMSSRNYQRRLQQLGRSFRGIKREAVIEHAQQLLVTTRHTITRISERCGFSHKSAFHRAFKRATGQTPEAYRSREVQAGRTHPSAENPVAEPSTQPSGRVVGRPLVPDEVEAVNWAHALQRADEPDD